MDFLLENLSGSSSSSNRSSEITKNETLSNQQQGETLVNKTSNEQGEILMNKTLNQDIFEKNEKKIVISEEGSYDLEINDEVHPSIERGRRKKMKDMFDDLSGLLPQLPSKVCISLFKVLRIFNNLIFFNIIFKLCHSIFLFIYDLFLEKKKDFPLLAQMISLHSYIINIYAKSLKLFNNFFITKNS